MDLTVRSKLQALPQSSIMFMIHHIFLPPQLPCEDDSSPEHENLLLDLTIDSLQEFRQYVVDDQKHTINSVLSMITSMKAIHDTPQSQGAVSEKELLRALRALPTKGGTILLHIGAQNSGIMITKMGDSIHVEAFELCPLNQQVFATKGRLRRRFPGPALAISISEFANPELQATIAHTLSKMSHQQAVGTQPQVKKAGKMHHESRDTTHPKIVTELFMGFLSAVGKSVAVQSIQKNTREEVMWRDALLPWRRSPVWILLRVAMQLVFSRLAGSGNMCTNYYKSFLLFLMGNVLQLSLNHGIPCDFQYTMNAKLGRRLLKLDPSDPKAGINLVESIMRQAAKDITRRWELTMVRASRHYDLSVLRSLNFEQDISIALPGFSEFVASLSARKTPTTTKDMFQPNSRLVKYHPNILPSPLCSSNEYLVYDLKAFEGWVASHLPQWLEHHKAGHNTCEQLGALIKTYHRLALPLYSKNPESMSLLLLTIIELWIACDQSALHLCPFLKDYDPGVPPEIFQFLILPLKSQMQRLLKVEEYLNYRRRLSQYPSPSIFQDYGSSTCFSVRYFDQSPLHQHLRQEIEADATKKWDQKVQQLSQKKDQYRSLMRLHEESECDYYEGSVDEFGFRTSKRHNDQDCQKCRYKNQANNIDIEVYEWPLPRSDLEAKSTVFELRVPSFVGQWRDTALFLHQILKAENESARRPKANYPLEKYLGLSSFFRSHSSGSTPRLGLLSETKSHMITHRRKMSVALMSVKDVCLSNALQYQYYDHESGIFVDKFDIKDEIVHSLTYQLPPNSSPLQPFLFRSRAAPGGPPPNTVIASLSNCPCDISLDEYKALCTLPLGSRSQWLNILLQLSAPAVDFRKTETSLVILQSIYQAGPDHDQKILRTGHQALRDQKFATMLLDKLNENLHRFREHWESAQAVGTFISLSARLLSLTTEDDITIQCLEYLHKARTVTFSWVNLLADKAYEATDDVQRAELLALAVDLALICSGTFNVDDRHLEPRLTSPEDGSTFIQCCIFIKSNISTNLQTSGPMTPILYQRWKSLCYRSYAILAHQIVTVDSRSLDNAIKKAWSTYMPSGRWRTLSEKSDSWLCKTMPPRENEKQLEVHYNLLTGELLVDGLPLNRLPAWYTQHSVYQTLFGSSNQEVMPSAVPGMQFFSRRECAGYTVDLVMRHHPQGTDLLVQGVKDNRRFYLIPSRILSGHFPLYFTEEFVHWYNAEDDCVEFRSVHDPWNSSAANWRLIRDPNNRKWRLVKDGLSLISPKSQTAKAICHIFSPLENSSHLHIVLQASASRVEIELPRLSLAFLLQSGTSLLRSKQFRGFVVDSDQSLRTLVGLESKLMLQNNETQQRSVIIPGGNVSWRRDCGHVSVTISHGTAVKAYAYHVDDLLGRFLDNGTLQSKLWICYLHALTSFCLPDPLIRTTGLEQALFILSSAAVRSFDQLSEDNVDVLHKIGQLTAKRMFYPLHAQVMQTVKWDSHLSFLTQHGELYKRVEVLFTQAKEEKALYPESDFDPPTPDGINPYLVERDCIRSSTFCVSGFGAEDHTVSLDAAYLARDHEQNAPHRFKAFVMSKFVFEEAPSIHYQVTSGSSDRLWKFLAQNAPNLVASDEMPPSRLKYDAELLQDWAKVVSKHWCTLHNRLSSSRPHFTKYQLMIWLSTLAFAENSDIEIVQTVGSFFVLHSMREISPPNVSSFSLSEGYLFQTDKLRSALRLSVRKLNDCPESDIPRKGNEPDNVLRQRRERQHQSNRDNAINQLIKKLESQWPCQYPVLIDCDAKFSIYMDMTRIKQLMEKQFEAWYRNYQLHMYLQKVESALLSVNVRTTEIPSLHLLSLATPSPRSRGFVSIDDMFSGAPPSKLPLGPKISANQFLVRTDESNAASRLESLLRDIEPMAGSSFESNYVEDLRGSLVSLQNQEEPPCQLSLGRETMKNILTSHLNECKSHVEEIHTIVLDAEIHMTNVTPPGQRIELNQLATIVVIGKQPRLCPILLLQQLSRHRWPKITQGWQKYLVDYALALTELQRAKRLLGLVDSEIDLLKELRNPGHTNWDPMRHPESLLLEVENGLLIREVQHDIARQMIDVDGNATMQLNMGEGKSSVIVPMVAGVLANGSRLVRVVTAKPQAKQMFQMLVSKLGGLLDRRICHMPFSRSLQLSQTEAVMMGDMCGKIMERGDILLVLPEHILSFKLMGLECLITGKDAIGRSLLHTQEFLNHSSRDIVDESDENFNVKFELIYTMGMQQPIELSPRRWIYIQQVLDLVKTFAPEVAQKSPSSLEIQMCPPGRFPRTRVLNSHGQQQLCTRIANFICETGLYGLPVARQPKCVRESVFVYLTKSSLSSDEISQVKGEGAEGFWTQDTNQTLLLLRGLLAGEVLGFAFRQKRWRVQYGLDMSRRPPTKLAVPYRAKDSPTLRSEFSHPDVVILLTCLSHYYGGIEEDDIFLAFEHLLKSDQADAEYQEWVKDAPELPEAFHQLAGINLKDRYLCTQQIFPPLRFAKAVIDYFLTHIVFPKEMREFPQKLSASGWDIGQMKTHPTSGFSGTNDSRMTLPLSVRHLDLEEQKHTNALVLEYLLRPENSVMLMPATAETRTSTAESLLDMVTGMDPPAQVILDVGAQILELSNEEVAKEWMKRVQDHERVQAVVFFSEDDELLVLDRKGRRERLQTSPFSEQLDVCLVFLDESHTRGTDLRLPKHYRAAVPLGANLTKDRLIQACMRMRKLGHGQSVVFCVPEEIARKIAGGNPTKQTTIAVSDVLSWAITETWTDVRRSMPLWAVQGRRFEYQQGVLTNAHVNGKLDISRLEAKRFLEDDSQSLESRYGPCGATSVVSTQDDPNENLQLIAKRCLEFDSLEHHTASLQEEQERELSPEIVAEREVERPAPAKAAMHRIHPDLTAFVEDGIIRSGSEAFKPAFETLRKTSAARFLDVSQFPRDVLVTVDFANTIQSSDRSSLLDAYQRPVQWILTSIGDGSDNVVKHLVIISPHEADRLQIKARHSKRVMLHIYAPRPNIGIRPLDGLDLYTISGMPVFPAIPSHFIIQLNLFAGQLYFRSFKEHTEVCTTLGLAWKTEDDSIIDADGFTKQRPRNANNAQDPGHSFKKSPVAFLRVLTTKIRKNCEAIEKTHMGAVLGGQLLRPVDFEEIEQRIGRPSQASITGI